MMMAEPLASPDGNLRAVFHSAESMYELADGEADLEVTSPPYGLGLDYGHNLPPGEKIVAPLTPGQVEAPVLSMADYSAYLRRLEPVWREMWRVLRPGGYACINVGAIHAKAEYFGHSFMLPQLDDITSFWRHELGAEFRWKYVWAALRTNHNSKGQNTPVLGSYPLPGEGQVIREVEEIAVLRKPGPSWDADPDRYRRRRLSRLTLAEWKKCSRQVWDDITGEGSFEWRNVSHPAVFPLEIPERLIRFYSCVGDLVLDPFGGRGTTLLAARKLGRRAMMYEVEGVYREMVAAYTGIRGPSVGRESKLEVEAVT